MTDVYSSSAPTESDEAAEEAERQRVESIEAAMQEQGISTTVPQQVSYFGFEERHQCFLPDGVSYIEHQTLNEGARRKYLNKVNRDIRLQRATGDAIMKMQAGEEKHALLQSAITGWNLLGPTGQLVPFSSPNLQMFLDKADPKVVDLIEKDIRKHNTWLMSDLSVEDIQKQIDELEEMKQVKLREEEGKES